MHGMGFIWGQEWDDTRGAGAAGVMIQQDGTVNIVALRSDIGLNAETTYCQIVAEELGMRSEDVFFRQQDDVYLPLMTPSLVAIGTYALLLAWNEYLYAFLLLSNDRDITLSVALGNFLAADDSPWELLMTTGLVYALPPAAIYYAFKRYMVAGLTSGAVKS
jgi:hypothetical protein